MTSSVWVNGNTPGSELHVTVDSMPAGGAGLTDAELRAVAVPVSGTFFQATQPVSAAALPLPSGAATAALQLPDSHNVTVDNAAGGAAVNIQDGGNTITVDGTVAVSNFPATQPVSGTVSVDNFPGASSGTEYVYNIPSQVHVASANTVHWDLFNGDAALIVRVMGIYQLPNIVTAVTGIAFDWLLERTTAVGTGGSVITAWEADTNGTDMDADITLRSKPTGGATQSTDLRNYTIHSEETNAATQMMHMMMAGGVANLVPPHLMESGTGIVLRQNQGIRCVQVTNSNAGNTGWCICIVVE